MAKLDEEGSTMGRQQMKSVYLAGPITGTSYGECTDWRKMVSHVFISAGIEPYSPMRAKDYLLGETTVSDAYDDTIMSSQRGIYARDFYDCRSKDALFVNLLGATRVSIGTVMEIAWAAAYQKPIVLVMEKENNIHEHSMLREACALRVETLNEGVDIMKALLLPVGH